MLSNHLLDHVGPDTVKFLQPRRQNILCLIGLLIVQVVPVLQVLGQFLRDRSQWADILRGSGSPAEEDEPGPKADTNPTSEDYSDHQG